MRNDEREVAQNVAAANRAWVALLEAITEKDYEKIRSLVGSIRNKLLQDNKNDSSPQAISQSVNVFRDLAQNNNAQVFFKKLDANAKDNLRAVFAGEGVVAKMLYTAATGDVIPENKQEEKKSKQKSAEVTITPKPKKSRKNKWQTLAENFSHSLRAIGIPKDVQAVFDTIENKDLRNYLMSNYKKMSFNTLEVPEVGDIKEIVDKINDGLSPKEFSKLINDYEKNILDPEPVDDLFLELKGDKKDLYQKAYEEIMAKKDLSAVSDKDTASSESVSSNTTPRLIASKRGQ